MNRKKFLSITVKEAGIGLVLVLLIIFFALVAPNFTSLNNIRNVFTQITINTILAVGVTYAILMSEIDLSVGANFGFLMMLLSIIIEKQNGNPWLASAEVLHGPRSAAKAGVPRAGAHSGPMGQHRASPQGSDPAGSPQDGLLSGIPANRHQRRGGPCKGTAWKERKGHKESTVISLPLVYEGGALRLCISAPSSGATLPRPASPPREGPGLPCPGERGGAST